MSAANVCLVCLSEEVDDALKDDDFEHLLNFAPCVKITELCTSTRFLCQLCYANLRQLVSFKELCMKSSSTLLRYVNKYRSFENRPTQSDSIDDEMVEIPTKYINSLSEVSQNVRSFGEEINTFSVDAATEIELTHNQDKNNDKVKVKNKSQGTKSEKLPYGSVLVKVLSEKEEKNEFYDPKNSDEFKAADFKCVECVMVFPCENTCREHFQMHTTISGEFICDICKLSFSSNNELNDHVNYHSIRFTCILCFSVTSSKNIMVDHLRYIHKISKYTWKCEFCLRSFREVNNCVNHEHGSTKLKTNNCHFCSQKFDDEYQLNHHVGKLHQLRKVIRCDKCFEFFRTDLLLNVHDQKVHKNTKHFHCQECDKEFLNMNSYKYHMQYGLNHVEPGVFKYTCDTCKKHFRHSLALGQHNRRVHGRRFKCTECEKTFGTNYKMMDHRRCHHEGFRLPKDRVCPQCGKCYDRRVLQIHLSKHCSKRKAENTGKDAMSVE